MVLKVLFTTKQIIMTKQNMVLFTNWLTEDFIGKWAGIEEVFKPGQSKYVEDWKGIHYAKHLVDQHMNNEKKPTSDISRKEFEKRCFGENIESEGNITSDIFNKNKELEGDLKASVSAKVQKPKSKEFTDLNKDGDNKSK